MEKNRPDGVTRFVILLVVTGIVVFVYGIEWLSDGVTSLNSPRNVQLLDLWGGYFRTYIWVGTLWILAGLGSLIAVSGLWKGREWGRKLAIISNLGAIFGWIVIRIVCRSFGMRPPIAVVILALPVVYLFTRRVREYCQSGSAANNA